MELHPSCVGHRDWDGVAFNLGGPSGHVMEEIRGERHVSCAGNGDGLPIIQGSSSASSSRFSRMRSPSFQTRRPRSDGLNLGQGPLSNARRAALTARSTSFLSPSAACAITSPVAGFSTGNVLPETAFDRLPIDQELAPFLFKLVTRLSSRISAVAILIT